MDRGSGPTQAHDVRCFLRTPAALGTPPDLFRGTDFDGAVAAAKSERKCALVLFARPGAPETKKLEMTTWNETKVREWIGLKAVAVRFDPEANADLATRLRVHMVPTIVFVGANGLEIDRMSGYVDGRAFLAETKAIFGGADGLERAKKRLAAAPTIHIAASTSRSRSAIVVSSRRARRSSCGAGTTASSTIRPSRTRAVRFSCAS